MPGLPGTGASLPAKLPQAAQLPRTAASMCARQREAEERETRLPSPPGAEALNLLTSRAWAPAPPHADLLPLKVPTAGRRARDLGMLRRRRAEGWEDLHKSGPSRPVPRGAHAQRAAPRTDPTFLRGTAPLDLPLPHTAPPPAVTPARPADACAGPRGQRRGPHPGRGRQRVPWGPTAGAPVRGCTCGPAPPRRRHIPPSHACTRL